MGNKLIFILLFSFFLLSSVHAQQLTQTIRGTAIDVDTREPLIGAEIAVTDLENVIGTTTDIDGKFELKNVPVGRRTVRCSYIGYNSVIRDNVNLNSAREYVLDFNMKAGVDVAEVVVEGYRRNEAVNELAVLSIRRLDPEELQFHAATANDPSRLVMGFPGVQPSWDIRNEIVVRGNSPLGVLWRLEGIDIPNPNHYAFAGGSGGGITIFSASMLGSSDFSTGAFTAEYGNALSGVFDMNFRNGNMYSRENTFRIGLLGVDFSTEGPIKEGKSSYLANFRYSTLGILNAMGIHLVGPRIDNSFYDASFKIHHKGDRSTFNLWGIGGSSFQNLNPDDTLEVFTQYRVYEWKTEMAALGGSWNYLIDDKSYIQSNFAITGQKLTSDEDTISLFDGVRSRIDEEYVVNNQISANTFYKRTFNPQLNLKAGFIFSHYWYDMYHLNMDYGTELETIFDVQSSTQLFQPYFQFSYRPIPKLMINFGAHSMFLALNNRRSIEPRFAVKYDVSEITSIAFSYGLHNRLLPWDIYYTDVNGELPNLDLPFLKSQHYILALDQMLGKTWRIHAEAYYQSLSDIPVVDDPERKISLINRVNDYNKEQLFSEGTGTNIGLDLTLEKFFDMGTFFVLSGSIFNSTYQMPNDNTNYNTRFNGRFSSNFTGGRTWKLSENSGLETSLKVIMSNGNPLVPLQSGTEGIAGRRPYWDFSNPYDTRVAAYIRPDLRIAYRKNNEKSAYWLALDIQNFINRANYDAFEYDYNPETLLWQQRRQALLTPILTFWIDF